MTSHFKHTCRSITTANLLQNHICYRFGWTARQFHWIDWPTHGIAVRQHASLKHFITKLVHGWLPLGKLTQHYNSHTPASCPSCNCPQEDYTHFLSCPNRPWKTPLLRDIKDYFETHPTCPILSEIFTHAVRSIIYDQPLEFPPVPPRFKILAVKQASIGWDQLLLGRFVTEWSDLQDDYSHSCSNEPQHQSGQHWVLGLTSLLWKHIHNKWCERNQDLHGKDATQQELAKRAQAQREIEFIYSLRPQTVPSDRFMFIHLTRTFCS